MFGKLKPDEVEQVLKHQLIGRIGCHADGLTYVFPISYAYDGEYIYCHAFEGMKMNIMRKNPAVCFEVENTKILTNWQSVIAWGVFEELPEGVQRQKALMALKERKLPMFSSETMQLGSQWPFSFEDDNIDGIVFRICLGEKTGRYEESASEPFFAV